MEYGETYFENSSIDYMSSFIEISDGKLLTEDGYAFPIHKYALAKNSRYFYALFCSMGKGRKEILIPGIQGYDLSNILRYLYTGIVYVTGDNIGSLIVSADYLILDDLLCQLKAYLKISLTIDNSISLLRVSLMINADDILQNVFRFVQTHFESIVLCKDSKIFELPLDTLKLLLSSRNLCVRSERTVWLAIVNWIVSDVANRLPLVPDLLMYLLISDVDENTANEILQHHIVAENSFCRTFFDFQAHFPNADNLQVLKHYFETYPRPFLALYGHRHTEKLHYIAHYTTYNLSNGIRVYLTYDEHFDLWREVFHIDLSPEIIFFLNNCIYLFKIDENRNLTYNVQEKQWTELADFEIARYNYYALELNGLIYVLGGVCAVTDVDIIEVEFYDPVTEEWYITDSMIPVTHFSGVTLDNSIYVLGFKLNVIEDEMLFQVYDSENGTWNALPLDPMIRFDFAMVVYRGMIYVIGGSDRLELLKTVQVFDPITNEWNIETELPFKYYFPKAIVLDDKLIVYDNHIDNRSYFMTNPPVQWNAILKLWEILPESTFANNLHMYTFLTVEDRELIEVLSRENKDPATVFEASHFA